LDRIQRFEIKSGFNLSHTWKVSHGTLDILVDHENDT